MKSDKETWLEGALVLFVLLLLAGAGALVFGGAKGGATRSGRHNEAPPDEGSVPSSRHQHTSSAAAR